MAHPSRRGRTDWPPTVWCWSGNIYGELGNGTTDGSIAPVQVHCE